MPPPNLVIYLQAEVDTLLRQINNRGRDFEQDIKREYIAGLNALYDAWIDGWDACPVLRVDMNCTDFQHNGDQFQAIVQQVQAALVPSLS